MVEELVVVAQSEEPSAPSAVPITEPPPQLPFKVATVWELEQRAYLRPDDNQPEWLFSRVHAYCGIAKEPGRLLRDNKESLDSEFKTVEMPTKELHYRGNPGEEAEGPAPTWKDHTVESRGFFTICLWVIRNRSMKALCKVKALRLLLEMVAKAFAALDTTQTFMGMVTNSEGRLQSVELTFNRQGVCHA